MSKSSLSFKKRLLRINYRFKSFKPWFSQLSLVEVLGSVSRILPAFVRGPQNNQDIFQPNLASFCANKIRQSPYGSPWLHVPIQMLINWFREKNIIRRSANETFQQKPLDTQGICVIFHLLLVEGVLTTHNPWVSESVNDLTFPVPLGI